MSDFWINSQIFVAAAYDFFERHNRRLHDVLSIIDSLASGLV
jgi:hypothetical protein